MEFHGVTRGVPGICEDTEGFHEYDHAGSVIDGARAAGRGSAAGGVEVSTHDDEIGGSAGDADDDAGLGIRVGELGNGDTAVSSTDGFDRVEEPGGRLGTIRGSVVSVVKAGCCVNECLMGGYMLGHYSERVFSQVWGPEVLSWAIKPLASV